MLTIRKVNLYAAWGRPDDVARYRALQTTEVAQ
jgi:hypothetical protein